MKTLLQLFRQALLSQTNGEHSDKMGDYIAGRCYLHTQVPEELTDKVTSGELLDAWAALIDDEVKQFKKRFEPEKQPATDELVFTDKDTETLLRDFREAESPSVPDLEVANITQEKSGSEDEGGLKIVENEENEKTAERELPVTPVAQKVGSVKLSKSLKRRPETPIKTREDPTAPMSRKKLLIDWTQVNSDESDQEKEVQSPLQKLKRKKLDLANESSQPLFNDDENGDEETDENDKVTEKQKEKETMDSSNESFESAVSNIEVTVIEETNKPADETEKKDQSINESRLSSDEEDDEKSEQIEPDGQSLDKSIFNTDTSDDSDGDFETDNHIYCNVPNKEIEMFVKPFKIKMTRLTRTELSKWANKTAPIEINSSSSNDSDDDDDEENWSFGPKRSSRIKSLKKTPTRESSRSRRHDQAVQSKLRKMMKAELKKRIFLLNSAKLKRPRGRHRKIKVIDTEHLRNLCKLNYS